MTIIKYNSVFDKSKTTYHCTLLNFNCETVLRKVRFKTWTKIQFSEIQLNQFGAIPEEENF